MEKYQNPTLSPKERAEDLLGRMTIAEKLAQVNCLFWQHGDLEKVTKNGIGHVSTLEIRAVKSLEEAAESLKRVQEKIMKNSRFGIPAIFHMEGVCGGLVQERTSFPSGIGRASSFDPTLEKRVGEVVGRQERAIGITQTLAPVLDISRDSRMGRQCETYGEDPSLAAAMGAAYTKGLQEESSGRKTDACAKHFLGFHASLGAIHGANVEIGERQLKEVYGKPFQAAIAESGLKGIMPCYCSINGKPASASGKLLTGLLREEMGFDGTVVADYSAVANVHRVQHLYESVGETALACMEAGMDVELPDNWGYGEELQKLFEEGKADIAVLDRAVERVLCAKFRMGLFEHPFALTGEALQKAFHQPEDEEITLQSARESIVLLKNKNHILPIDRHFPGKIALIGCHGSNGRFFFGGYTHLSMVEAIYAAANSLAGVDATNAQDKEGKPGYPTIPGTKIQSDETEEFADILKALHPGCRNLYEELKDRMPGTEISYAYGYPIAGTDESRFAEALEMAEEADLLILTLGGKNGSGSIASMGEGVDGTDINLPPCQERFLEEAAKLGKPMIGIHLDGRPISDDAADKYLDAILEAWNPSEKGAQAIVDVLLGIVNPSGRLPVTVAFHAGQLPIFYNHDNGSSWHQGESIGFADYVDLSHHPRYYFGHGLSYTDFSYRDLEIAESSTEKQENAAQYKTEQDIAGENRNVVLKKKEGNPSKTMTGTTNRESKDVEQNAQRESFNGKQQEEKRQKVRISCLIKNTGNREGTEVVQLYVSDSYASMIRPVQELAGFVRVSLAPGEEKIVTFDLYADQLAFVDEEGRWKVEAGEIEVKVGSSSEDIRLRGTFTIRRSQYIEGRSRSFYTLGQVR